MNENLLAAMSDEEVLRLLPTRANGDEAATQNADEQQSMLQHWPEPPALEAFHGVAGEIARAIEPFSEADPAAVLIQFLVGFGNAVGAGPHSWVEATRHGVNENAAIVGSTAKARKGTSWGNSRAPLAFADPEWAEQRIKGGLASGEGLINEVRDAVGDDKGAADKRLLVFESELGGLFRVMARDGNNTSAVIRQFFDDGRAQVINKNSPIAASSAHVSLIGHITQEELTRYLDRTELANGFANRFLWICARRSKILPDGGRVPECQLQTAGRKVALALDFGRRHGVFERTSDAKEFWHSIYEQLSEGAPGLYGAVTSRAEAHVLRLSMIYAILDCSDGVQPKHLKAALALWDYADRSARYLFGDVIGDPVADPILKALKGAPEGMTRLLISNVLGRHRNSAQIDRALAMLERTGAARCVTRKTKGRPQELWFALKRGGLIHATSLQNM